MKNNKLPPAKRRIPIILLVLVGLSAEIVFPARIQAATRNGKAHPPELLTPPAGAPAAGQCEACEQTVIRKRHAGINFVLLSQITRQGGGTLRLNLFEDLVLDAHLTKIVKRSCTSYTWFGKIRGHELGAVSLAVENNTVAAVVRLPAASTYRIRHLADEIFEVSEIDNTQVAPCGDVIIPEQMHQADRRLSQPNLSDAQISPASDDGSIMDVMVVYTGQAKSHLGGTDSITAIIHLLVDESNLAYLNSQVFSILRLVHAGEVDYIESGDTSTDLSRLRSNGDGYMDSVHTLRNTYGADMVCLIACRGFFQPCGKAYLMTSLSSSFASYAFSWVGEDCLMGFYAFPHELGHNMGCHHAVGDGGTPRGQGLYYYSHGWRWYGDSGTQFRSLMAYDPGTVVGHFSNPNVLYDNQPTGRIGLEDNARTINNAAYTIASWRQSTLPYTPPQVQDYFLNLEAPTSQPQLVHLQACDEGHPNPPAKLVYIIRTLPRQGTIQEPNATTITTVPYVLPNGGSEVIYTPETSLTCPDRFKFSADDGGSPPQAGESTPATVTIRISEPIYVADMNTDPAWSLKRKWQWGQPAGNGYDPSSGYTGLNVIGYNLDGDYAGLNSTQYATTPPIDCGGYQDVRLTFYRWLSVYTTDRAHANIQVSNNGTDWTELWHNGEDRLVDASWKYIEFDISQIADNQPLFYIRWGMGPCDKYLTFGGWNLDDVKVCGTPIPATPSADIQIDCRVDLFDFALFADAWLTCQGHPMWDPNCDLAQPIDNCINTLDLAILAQNWLTIIE